jgi:hypothetical protein
MPLPTGHWEHSTGPRQINRRERWLIAGVLGGVAVVVIAVVIAFTTHQHKSRNGCIDVSAATAIGGSELYRCGTAARQLCTSPDAGNGSENIAFRQQLADACRKAGLPIPRVGSS